MLGTIDQCSYAQAVASPERSHELARTWKEEEWNLDLSLLSLPVQVAGLVLLHTILQLLLGAAAAGLRSLQVSQQIRTPAQQIKHEPPDISFSHFVFIRTTRKDQDIESSDLI